MGDINKWPVFNLLSPEFISKIRVAYVYGSKVQNTLIVTDINLVYQIQYNSQRHLEINYSHNAFRPKIIISLCELDIKTFAFFQGPYILILTNGGVVYSMSEESFDENECITEDAYVMIESFNNEFVEDIACGNDYSLVLTSSGTVYYIDSTQNKTVNELKIILNKRVASISCGYMFNVMVTTDEEVYSWGDINYKFDINNVSRQPTKVKNLDGIIIKKVACGRAHVLALSDEGDVYVWGSNNNRQLGLCTNKSVHTPEKLVTENMKQVVDVAASCHNDISIAMDMNNHIFVWGRVLEWNIVPTLTSVSSIHDAFALYASSKVMHKPLIIHEDNENSILGLQECLFDDPTTSDLIIQVHGNPLHAHKSILMIRCQYFKKRFQKRLRSKNNENQSVIEENMFSLDIFKAFLRYLYTDKIDLSPEDTCELLKLADHYSVNELKIYGTQYICKHITVKNVIVLYNMAIAYNFKKLEDSCVKFILRNMTAVVQTSSFAKLKESCIKKFLIQAAEAGVFRT